MANTYLQIDTDTARPTDTLILEVGVEDKRLKISIEERNTETFLSVWLGKDEAEELIEFLSRKIKKEL